MREVTIKELHERFRFDPLSGAIFRASDKGRRPLGSNRNGYWVISMGACGCKPAHHVAWAIHYGYWPAEIDHRDHDKLNNRLSNLRLATRSQNNANIRKSRGSSKAKGVYWETKRKSFRAHVRFHGKSIHLGYFDIEDEAAHAYNKKAIELFGEYASLNPVGIDKEAP